MYFTYSVTVIIIPGSRCCSAACSLLAWCPTLGLKTLLRGHIVLSIFITVYEPVSNVAGKETTCHVFETCAGLQPRGEMSVSAPSQTQLGTARLHRAPDVSQTLVPLMKGTGKLFFTYRIAAVWRLNLGKPPVFSGSASKHRIANTGHINREPSRAAASRWVPPLSHTVLRIQLAYQEDLWPPRVTL